TLGTDAIIPAGEAIALQITTAQAGVNFQIRYDSHIYPSQISLPVNTFIDVDVVGVYNAAHPNGIVITDVPNLGNSYVRVIVTDPFGADDISSVNLSLIKPDLSTVDVLLNMAYEVASDGCEKIYQYLWSNPGNLGNWQIHATANE